MSTYGSEGALAGNRQGHPARGKISLHCHRGRLPPPCTARVTIRYRENSYLPMLGHRKLSR